MVLTFPDAAATQSIEPFEGLGDDLRNLVRRVKLVAFDFDGVFTDNAVYVTEEGIEAVRCWRSDGLGLRKLEALGLATMILSTEENAVVTTRSRKLKIRCVQGCVDKAATLETVLEDAGLGWDEVAFVGNDINDLECLKRVALPIVVQDAHREVLAVARYRTRTPGGFGAVREVCDLFENVLVSTTQ